MGVAAPDGRAVRSIIVHRIPEREPRGRWMDCRTTLTWPDTLLPPESELWGLRLLNLAGLVVAQVVPATATRHLISAIAMVALMIFTEFWIRIEIGPVWRRFAVFAVNTALLAAAIAATPMAGIASWSGYMLYASLFTGAPLLFCVAGSCVLMTATQRNGWHNLSVVWWVSILSWLLNVVIGLAVVAVIDARETTLLRRRELTDQLLAERSRNADLQQEIVEQARRTGVQDERARLARELHDTVAQGFVAVVTQLESIDEDGLVSAARERVDNAKALAREGLGEARRAVNALQPVPLDSRSLPTALQDQLTAFAGRNSVAATLRVDGEPRVVDGDDSLLRIVQESLANIARHAGASHVVVTLTYLDDTLLLDIRDDGRGFCPRDIERGTDGGFGLVTMTERAGLIGGVLEIESEPGAGCVISVAVPTAAPGPTQAADGRVAQATEAVR
ncbi:sensor histidine kinase [Jongsikchunia kroppenstedtii]|uniref:sensor histidine kinase n=1 Tax=Jongsikchunia kroppenstedtii TaxID=1121721 RepID=UPI00036EC21B|nr:sensor histidine kinase [Jongsikchunia kroppenstedtii]